MIVEVTEKFSNQSSLIIILTGGQLILQISGSLGESEEGNSP